MEKKVLYILLSLILIISSVFFISGCEFECSGNTKDLTSNVTAASVDEIDLAQYNAAVTDFAVRLFQNSLDTKENTLISPLSVLCALSMTSNGASGKTLAQMEQAFGLSTDELNQYLYTYTKHLPQGKNYKLSLANSIWFTDRDNFSVNEDFLQTNAAYYDADLYQAAFDDSTVKDINKWVKKNTDDKIPMILDTISEDAVMYLINALAFDAKWQDVYKETQVTETVFTNLDGTETNVEMMYSGEYLYLEDEQSCGFMKYYEDQKYAFAALLPNENIDIFQYISDLDGEHLHNLLSNPQDTYIETAIPIYEYEYNVEMSTILNNMGIQDAFDSDLADFSDLGTSKNGNIFINQVIHKSFISVAEKGTTAGAATVVEMNDGGAFCEKFVYLNRPFVYMLVDCENDVPFFIGAILEMNK